MLTSTPKTGWFEATEPLRDYAILKAIARRSSLGDRNTVETLDLIGLEGDFRKGKYQYVDYYSGFIDGDGRMDQARNARNDMNAYLRALRYFEQKHGDLSRLAAVRFHQTNHRIDKVQFIERDPPSVIC